MSFVICKRWDERNKAYIAYVKLDFHWVSFLHETNFFFSSSEQFLLVLVKKNSLHAKKTVYSEDARYKGESPLGENVDRGGKISGKLIGLQKTSRTGTIGAILTIVRFLQSYFDEPLDTFRPLGIRL